MRGFFLCVLFIGVGCIAFSGSSGFQAVQAEQSGNAEQSRQQNTRDKLLGELQTARASYIYFRTQFSENHPAVAPMKARVASLEKQLQEHDAYQNKEVQDKSAIDELSDKELRDFVHTLASRIIKLEQEVDLLKKAQANIELSRP